MADSTKAKKNYVKGSAKEVTFSNGGTIINLDLKAEDLQRLTPNKGGYIKLTLSKLSKTDDYGNTHSIYENDFKPDESKAKAAGKPTIAAAPRTKASPTTSDDLPF